MPRDLNRLALCIKVGKDGEQSLDPKIHRYYKKAGAIFPAWAAKKRPHIFSPGFFGQGKTSRYYSCHSNRKSSRKNPKYHNANSR